MEHIEMFDIRNFKCNIQEAVDACGSENFIISSDTGHPRKTMAPETSRMFAQSLTYKGVKQADVERMLKDNYHKLLEID